MSALKEPVTRYRQILNASNSPTRVTKQPRQQTSRKSVVAAAPGLHEQHPSSVHTRPLLHPMHEQTPDSLVSMSSTASGGFSNALQFSRGITQAPNQRILNNPLAKSDLKEQPSLGVTARRRTASAKKAGDSKRKMSTDAIAGSNEVVEDLPTYSYKDSTHKPTRKYIRTSEEANEALKFQSGPLGLDMEWEVRKYPRFKQNPVATVQISSARTIYIIQVSAIKNGFPRELKRIIEDPMIIKAGVNIKGDAKKIYSDHQIKAQNIVELSYLSRQADPLLPFGGKATHRTLISLEKLVGKYLGKKLIKSEQLSRWESRLTEEQLEYAANDVYCGLELYSHFVQLAKRNELTLKSQTFTLNVSLSGEIVAAEPEESTETSTSTQASPIDETTSTSKAPTSRSQKRTPLIVTQAKGKRAALISLKTRDIIEISDSDSEEAELTRLAASMRDVTLDNVTSKPNSWRVPPMDKNPFGTSPFSDGPSFLSKTMSYALGLKK